MSIDSYSLRRFLRMIVAPVISIGVVGYFTYHLVHGNRGLLALWQLNHEISQAELVLTQTGEAKAEMERKVVPIVTGKPMIGEKIGRAHV